MIGPVNDASRLRAVYLVDRPMRHYLQHYGMAAFETVRPEYLIYFTVLRRPQARDIYIPIPGFYLYEEE